MGPNFKLNFNPWLTQTTQISALTFLLLLLSSKESDFFIFFKSLLATILIITPMKKMEEPTRWWLVKTFRSGNSKKDSPNVIAFLALLTMASTSDPKCLVRTVPQTAEKKPNVQNEKNEKNFEKSPWFIKKKTPSSISPDKIATKKEIIVAPVRVG